MNSLQLPCCVLAFLVSGAASIPDASEGTRDGSFLALKEPVGNTFQGMNLTNHSMNLTDYGVYSDYDDYDDYEAVSVEVTVYLVAAGLCSMYNLCSPAKDLGETHC